MRQSKPIKLALTLTSLTIVASILLTFGARFTEEQRRLSYQQHLINQLSEVKINGYDNQPLHSAQHTESGDIIYPFYAGDVALGYAIKTIAKDGYSGDIHLLIGINPQGEITAVQPLKHRETPGLGDRIEPQRSEWIHGFSKMHREMADRHWKVKKDGGHFDNLSGATITARAVLNQVKNTLEENIQ